MPGGLRELAEETGQVLTGLAEPDGDTEKAHEACDQLRAAYGELYGEAEAFAHSTILARSRAAATQARREAAARPVNGAEAPGSRGADRVPHALRAMVPPAARTKLRKALGRER